MKAINKYIIEKLHLNKGIKSGDDVSLSLHYEIEKILLDKFGFTIGIDYRIYLSDDKGQITDAEPKNATYILIYFAKQHQTEWISKNKNVNKHNEIVNILKNSNLYDIEDIEVKEHKYLPNKLKISIKIKRG